MAEAVMLHDRMFEEDPQRFRATVAAFRASGMGLEVLDGLLRGQGASARLRLEVRILWRRPEGPLALAQLLHLATGSDLLKAVPDACRRHGLNPLSLVALETTRPLALGRSLGLPDTLVRTMPGKRRADQGVGLWSPARGSVRPEPFANMALKRLAVVDQPDLTALPEGLHVSEAITLDRLPRLERLSGVLDHFHGSLRLRCAGSLDDLPRDLDLRLLVVEGQAWEQPPIDRVAAPRVELRHLPRLSRLSGRFETPRLEVVNCPALEVVEPLEGLVPAAEPDLKTLREGRAFQGAGLTIQHCMRLSALDPRLRVPGNLALRDCGVLAELPSNLEAWRLELVRLPALRKLPAGLRLRGDLVLDGLGALETLPPGLQVGGDLILREMARPLPPPEDLQVAGAVQMHPVWATPAWKRFRLAHRVFGNLR